MKFENNSVFAMQCLEGRSQGVERRDNSQNDEVQQLAALPEQPTQKVLFKARLLTHSG
jgi:hypothetical protein